MVTRVKQIWICIQAGLKDRSGCFRNLLISGLLEQGWSPVLAASSLFFPTALDCPGHRPPIHSKSLSYLALAHS